MSATGKALHKAVDRHKDKYITSQGNDNLLEAYKIEMPSQAGNSNNHSK